MKEKKNLDWKEIEVWSGLVQSQKGIKGCQTEDVKDGTYNMKFNNE